MRLLRLLSRDGSRLLTLTSLLGLALFAAAALGNTLPQSLSSSVMWQVTDNAAERFVYPPGVPAVLRPSSAWRTLRIEQYYAQPVSAEALSISVQGSWPETPENELVENPDGSRSGKYARLSAPRCDAEKYATGHRCIVDLMISPETPSGTIGLSIGLSVGGQTFSHQNSVFWVVLPEMDALHYEKKSVFATLPSPLAVHASGFAHGIAKEVGSSSLSTAQRDRIIRSTVQITLDGNFSLGSGFFIANPDLVVPIFGTEVANAIRALPQSTRFILTAAHLFPLSYGALTRGAIHRLFDHSQTLFEDGDTYDLLVGGQLVPRAAKLLATNMESDLALMALTTEAEQTVLQQGNLGQTDLLGLNIASTMEYNVALDVFGYPVSSSGKITHRRGYLPPDGWPTDDTSNFGPLIKFKLEAIDTSVNLAESGLSGGPIVNSVGEVVGLAMERPNDSNSLVAIDLTNLAKTPPELLSNERGCTVRFNPFDRVLRLKRDSDDCSYGRFGSPQPFSPLKGEWAFQEVLGFADDDLKLAKGPKAKHPNGFWLISGSHTTINGHAIIDGQAIINGRAVIRRSHVLIDRNNIDEINSSEMVGGFKLNPDSFRPMVNKGVRILRPGHAMMASQGRVGELIVAIRNNRQTKVFTPVYAIRDFVIWWHKVSTVKDADQLLCASGEGCVPAK